MFIVFLYFYNSETTYDIKLKFSAFLSYVEVNTCVKFQMHRYKGFKVGIFRISPIAARSVGHIVYFLSFIYFPF